MFLRKQGTVLETKENRPKAFKHYEGREGNLGRIEQMTTLGIITLLISCAGLVYSIMVFRSPDPITQVTQGLLGFIISIIAGILSLQVIAKNRNAARILAFIFLINAVGVGYAYFNYDQRIKHISSLIDKFDPLEYEHWRNDRLQGYNSAPSFFGEGDYDWWSHRNDIRFEEANDPSNKDFFETRRQKELVALQEESAEVIIERMDNDKANISKAKSRVELILIFYCLICASLFFVPSIEK